jgi:hypothetical protein
MIAHVRINKITILYLLSAITLFLVAFVTPQIVSYRDNYWTQHNQMIGELLVVWGLIFGGIVVLTAIFSFVQFLYEADADSFKLRFTPLEVVLLLIFLFNIVGCVIGLARNEGVTHVAGDFLKNTFIPLFYFWSKKSLDSDEDILRFTKMLIVVDGMLFIIFGFTNYMTYAQVGRTFLYTVYFTLYFEEQRALPKLIFEIVTLIALYIVITTGGFRGTLMVFGLVVLTNFFLNFQGKVSIQSAVVLVGGILLAVGAISFFELEKDVDFVSVKFASTVDKENRRYLGLDESGFQRLGEFFDVAQTFQRENKIYLLVGFGNGATLNNTLITPSEKGLYGSQRKHNIYNTPLALLYRHGIIGLILFGYIYYFIIRSAFEFRRYRKRLPPVRMFVFLKVLIIYHLSVVVFSLLGYNFIGNIIIAFTLPLHSHLRERMMEAVKGAPPVGLPA